MRKATIPILSTITVLCSIAAGCGASATDGAVLFQKEGCVKCHKFEGRGGTIGPDLTNVVKRWSDSWIGDQIKNPWLHFENPGMPSHEYLSERQISDLIAYLKSSQTRK